MTSSGAMEAGHSAVSAAGSDSGSSWFLRVSARMASESPWQEGYLLGPRRPFPVELGSGSPRTRAVSEGSLRPHLHSCTGSES